MNTDLFLKFENKEEAEKLFEDCNISDNNIFISNDNNYQYVTFVYVNGDGNIDGIDGCHVNIRFWNDSECISPTYPNELQPFIIKPQNPLFIFG